MCHPRLLRALSVYHPERTMARSARPLHLAEPQWSLGHRGYCEATTLAPEQEQAMCTTKRKGSWRLPGNAASSMARATSWCKKRCLWCERCVAISVNREFMDCSWFDHCELGLLNDAVPGFRTLQLLSRAAAPRRRGFLRERLRRGCNRCRRRRCRARFLGRSSSTTLTRLLRISIS